jgi:sigma-E factor negative regulatory protein RseB
MSLKARHSATMDTRVLYGLACALGLWTGVGAAQADAGSDPRNWLNRAQTVARTLSYSGVFVHAQGATQSTSRITHILHNGQELETVETLDGPFRQFRRRGNETICYMADDKAVRIDRRITGRFFPQLINSSAETISQNYEIKLGGVDRVAGFDCRWIHIEPRDQLRHPQRLCSELNTGLLLRSRLVNHRDETLEEFRFTDLKVGNRVGRELLVTLEGRDEKRRSRAFPAKDDSIPADTGWSVKSPPAGFRKVAELRRSISGRQSPVSHLVLSDGLASVSVFVEPLLVGHSVVESMTSTGCSSIFVSTHGENMVTVLGEVPAATAQAVGKGLVFRPPSP